MKEYIEIPSLLTEAMMMYQSYGTEYVFVEGDSDVVFYKQHLNNKKKYYRSVDGWENVVAALTGAKERHQDQIYGIIDKDYHSLVGDDFSSIPNLVMTEENDIEMHLFSSPAFDKFVEVCCSEDKIKALGDYRELILQAAACIGVYRFISYRGKYGFVFENIDIKSVVDKDTLILDEDKFLNLLFAHTRTKGKEVRIDQTSLKEEADQIKDNYTPNELCRGHDVIDIISLAMQKKFATNNARVFTPEIVYTHLVMGFSTEYLVETMIYRRICHSEETA